MAQDSKDPWVHLESKSFPTDRVQVRKLRGRERISALYEIELVSFGEEALDTTTMTGAPVELVLHRRGLEARRFPTMIADVDDFFSTEENRRVYALRLVPRAHCLALVAASGIFMNVSVPELVQRKLELVGLGSDLKLALLGTYTKRELVTQYGETDLALVSRLTEHLGVSFFFEQHDGGEKIVFTDHKDGFHRPDDARMAFHDRGEEHDVFHLQARRRLVPAGHTVHDYNYRTPHVDLFATAEVPEAPAGGVVEYGVHVKTPAEAATLARVRAEERASAQYVYTGRSDLPDLAAGMRRTLEDHPTLGSVDLLIVEVEHEGEQVVDGGTAAGHGYRNTFKAIPASQTYRPPRVTPRPRIHGVVGGVVDGGPAKGTTRAYLDDQGRYLVKFFFDTLDDDKQAPSKPVRMAQPHAGPDYGMHLPLKPGTEVLVAFVDGDPDRPVIVGAVPNPVTRSPVDRTNATVHRIKTQSGIYMDLVDEDGARS
jgi:type VI secretion system secreted protein VgrG